MSALRPPRPGDPVLQTYPVAPNEAGPTERTKIDSARDFSAAWGAGDAASCVRARDEQIAAWCDEHAAAAKQEAETHDAQRATLQLEMPRNLVAYASKSDRIARCEGQASAFEALAAILRGAK